MICRARTGLTAISLAAVLGLSACATVPQPVQVGPVRYSAPAQIGSGRPVLASIPAPPSINIIDENPAAIDDTPTIVKASRRLYCVEFARDLSGIALQGNAKTWWDHAQNKYVRERTPEPGAVMVFAGTRKMKSGHVAVVKRVVSNREIRIDHANWMNDGQIYLNAAVVDVSPQNDWSQVRVWNTRGGQMGSRVYPIKGFIATQSASAN